MEELSQLDELIESDILEALGENLPENLSSSNEIQTDDIQLKDLTESVENDILIENFEEELPTEKTKAENEDIKEITTNISQIDIASILTELLNNKTIEITIKIKD